MGDGGGDWWRPAPGSKLEQRVNFLEAAVGIASSSFALAAITWTLASTEDGRIKALLWWCYGITAAGAYLLLQISRREHRDKRFARALGAHHLAHHRLRDAAYERYIARLPESTWKACVSDSLVHFATSFSVATGTPCHATIKIVDDPGGAGGESRDSAADLEVETYARSANRSEALRPGVLRNSVGRNTDFRTLFSNDADNRCWCSNDLLAQELYENTHWPDSPTRRNIPYRSTMVWPIRKVLRERSSGVRQEVYIHGFVTVDTMEPNAFDYDRHFELGAAYADHLLSVLWDPDQLSRASKAIAAASQTTPNKEKSMNRLTSETKQQRELPTRRAR